MEKKKLWIWLQHKGMIIRNDDYKKRMIIRKEKDN